MFGIKVYYIILFISEDIFESMLTHSLTKLFKRPEKIETVDSRWPHTGIIDTRSKQNKFYCIVINSFVVVLQLHLHHFMYSRGTMLTWGCVYNFIKKAVFIEIWNRHFVHSITWFQEQPDPLNTFPSLNELVVSTVCCLSILCDRNVIIQVHSSDHHAPPDTLHILSL